MSAGIPYLGSKISLISKSEIRYEGILYTIDTNESTVALAKVKSFGTEDRPTDRPVAPREEVYEYIIFRGSDIKDIRVCHPPKPQPTLQGGLPNDPAIVQHSASDGPGFGSSPGSSRARPNSGSGGSGGFGPIGATTGGFGGSSGSHPAPFSAAPGAPLGGGDSRGHQGASPVIDMLNSSRTSSPTARHGADSPSHQRGRGGRGAPSGFHRGGRGGRGGGAMTMGPGGNAGGHPGRGGMGMGRGGRGGFIPGRPSERKKDTLKFDSEYDFEQANEQFAEVLSKLQITNKDDEKADSAEEKEKPLAVSSDVEDGEIKESSGGAASGDEAEITPPDAYYNKSKSFFDSISCEALERSKGNMNKPDWRAEKKLNKETFGVTGGGGYRRGYGFRGGNRGGWGGGGRGRGGYNQRGGGYGGYNNYNNNNGFGGNGGRFSRDQRAGGGYQGRGGWNQGRGGGPTGRPMADNKNF